MVREQRLLLLNCSALVLGTFILLHNVQVGVAQNCGCASGYCCSKFGYCGTGSDYCGDGCKGGPCYGSPPPPASCGCSSTSCCSKYGYCGTTSEYCGDGCRSGPCYGASPPPPSSSSGLGSVLSESTFNGLFPNKNSFYSYSSFINAAKSFGKFGTTGDTATKKREVAAFLANVNQETGGLVYVEEIDKSFNYCDTTSTQYPCASKQYYYGRGPLQLSWNYNYGAAGSALGLNLLNNPGLVSSDATTAWKTALWFWSTASGSKPSCHDVMVGNWSPSASDQAAGRYAGFGMTINIINGGIECGSNPKNANGANNRVSYYRSISSTLSVDPGSNLYCSSMQPYA